MTSLPITPIPVTPAPFQGGTAGLSITDTLIASAATMSFVNDGYTVLYVANVGTASNIVIQSIPDNAGRVANIAGAVEENATTLYGPFEPIWWNYGGLIYITFSSTSTVTVAAVSFQI